MGLWIVVKGKDDPKTTLLAAFNYVNTENFILKTLGRNHLNFPFLSLRT